MGILQINTELVGESGVNPRLVRIVSDDNLATITAAGYLNPVSLQGYTIFPTDFIFMDYDLPIQHDIFIPSITNGIITLVLYTSSAGVNFIPPVVANHFALFANAGGDIKDNGYIPSSATVDTTVTMMHSSATVGNLAQFFNSSGTLVDSGIPAGNVVTATVPTVVGDFASFSDTTGDIIDNGYVPSDPSQTNVVMANGGTTATHVAFFADNNGTVNDMGVTLSDPANKTIAMSNYPVGITAGNLASFFDIFGTVQDSGIAASSVPTVTTPTATGDFANFSNTSGAIEDNGYLASNAALTNVVMANGATVVGDIAQFSDVNGTVQDSGVPIANLVLTSNVSINTFGFAGGSTTTTDTIAGLTAASALSATINTQTTGGAYIVQIEPGNPGANNFTVTFNVDPGNTTYTVVAAIAPF